MRTRLTLLYGCLFLASGMVLLAATYVLVDRRLSSLRVSSGPPPRASVSGAVRASSAVAGGQRAWQLAALHQLVIQSGLALALTAVVAVALGWVMAGRSLRPLRGITAATRRISERNLHERLALTGSRDEVKALADTIDGLLARLDAAFGSQRRFVANASHELRTPLMLTQTLLQVALADPDLTLASLRGVCQEVLLVCKEQDRLIGALLTLARGQRGIERREPVDLAAIARRVLGVHGALATSQRVRLDAALGPATVSGDPRLAEIAVSNLIENAIRYNNPGGYVQVETGVSASGPRLAVRNTGPRVPPGQLDRLTQPFQRLAGDRDQAHDRGGLGLGLSIVTAIVTAHGAALSITPRPGGGLTAEVTFPARPGPPTRPR